MDSAIVQVPIGTENYLWMVIAAGIAAFVASFGIGANDVANAFASSVGAKSLKLWQAVIIAAIFEFGGAVLLGAGVTSTIRQGIARSDSFKENPELLMLGMLCADIGNAIWLLLATKLKLAVSTTHTIVGAIIGVFIVAGGWNAIYWDKVGLIVLSWFTSPILSGIVSSIFFFCSRYFLLRKENSLVRTMRFYPILVSVTVAINVFFIIYKGAPGLGLQDTPIWLGVVIAIAVGIVLAILIQFLGIPLIKKRLDQWEAKKNRKEAEKQAIEMESQEKALAAESKEGESTGAIVADKPVVAESTGLKGKFMDKLNSHKDLLNGKTMTQNALEDKGVSAMHDHAEKFDEKTEQMFVYLQIFTAIFDSFAHGANDVANAVAPFAAVYSVYVTGGISSKSGVPVWILALGGGGIVVGLLLYGYRIIQALGMELTKITPSRGYSIEIGTAFTAVAFSIAGVPISTTQCQVGSTTAIGFFDGIAGVNKMLFLKTFCGWVMTLIFSALISAGVFAFAAYSPYVIRYPA